MRLETPPGAPDSGRPYEAGRYLSRPLLEGEIEQSVFDDRCVSLIAPRGWGKTWLLRRIVEKIELRRRDVRVLHLDCEVLRRALALSLFSEKWESYSEEQRTRMLAHAARRAARHEQSWVSDRPLRLLSRPELYTAFGHYLGECWESDHGAAAFGDAPLEFPALSDYVRERLLESSGTLLLAIDNLESLGAVEGYQQMLAGFRSWIERHERPWLRLLLLVTSSLPISRLNSLTSSTFMARREFWVDDWPGPLALLLASQLAQRLGRRELPAPPKGKSWRTAFRRLTSFVDGNPALLDQVVTTWMVSEPTMSMDSLDSFTAQLIERPSVFEGHLATLRRAVFADSRRSDVWKSLIRGDRQVLGMPLDDPLLQRLGLVALRRGRWVPRCELYARHLLVGESAGEQGAAASLERPEETLPGIQLGGGLERQKLSIRRGIDREIQQTLWFGGNCFVLAPQQCGKSSLRLWLEEQFRDTSACWVQIDLGGLDAPAGTEAFYRHICKRLGESLSVPELVHKFDENSDKEEPADRLARCLELAVERSDEKNIFLVFDEAEQLLIAGSDPVALAAGRLHFFTVLAASLQQVNARLAHALTCCFFGNASFEELVPESVELFRKQANVFYLADFTREELAQAAAAFPKDYPNVSRLLSRVYHWTGGHPFLSLRLCEELRQQGPHPLLAEEPEKVVDAVVERLYLEPKVPPVDPCIQTIRQRICSPPLTPLQLERTLRTYNKLIQQVEKSPEPLNPHSPEQRELWLCGLLARRIQEDAVYLGLRNRIFSFIFDEAWQRALWESRLLTKWIHRWLIDGRQIRSLPAGEELAQILKDLQDVSELTEQESAFVRLCLQEELKLVTIKSNQDLEQLRHESQKALKQQSSAHGAEIKKQQELMTRERTGLNSQIERQRLRIRSLRISLAVSVVLALGGSGYGFYAWRLLQLREAQPASAPTGERAVPQGGGAERGLGGSLPPPPPVHQDAAAAPGDGDAVRAPETAVPDAGSSRRRNPAAVLPPLRNSGDG